MTTRGMLSFAFMQAGWFACVLGATHGYSWLGPGVISAGLVIHVQARPRGRRAEEVLVLALATALGFLVDSALLGGGVVTIAGATFSPPWLVALWPSLAAATARGGSLGSLRRHPLLGALLGAVAAPMAYDAGARLGAIGLEPSRVLALVTIGAAWSIVLPTLFWVRARSRVRRTRRERTASGSSAEAAEEEGSWTRAHKP